MVSSVGFYSKRGSLVKDILFPRDIHFAFYTDSYKFVGIMACVAIIGFVVTIPVMLNIGTDP